MGKFLTIADFLTRSRQLGNTRGLVEACKANEGTLLCSNEVQSRQVNRDEGIHTINCQRPSQMAGIPAPLIFVDNSTVETLCREADHKLKEAQERVDEEKERVAVSALQLDEIAELVGPGGDGTPFGRVESAIASFHTQLEERVLKADENCADCQVGINDRFSEVTKALRDLAEAAQTVFDHHKRPKHDRHGSTLRTLSRPLLLARAVLETLPGKKLGPDDGEVCGTCDHHGLDSCGAWNCVASDMPIDGLQDPCMLTPSRWLKATAADGEESQP
jgi:hypothetical protein